MWPILEIIFLAAIALISITEFFIPIITGKPLFGSFRKTNKTKDSGEPSLKENEKAEE